MSKLIKTNVIALLVLLSAATVSAQDCSLRISVAPITQGDEVPAAINTKIENQLMRAVSACGVSADPYYGQFFIAGRFDAVLDDVIAGTPVRHVLKSSLTVYIGDAENRQVYASQSFDLKGVGNSEERAYINAIETLRSSNAEFRNFVENAKRKIIDYFNANYKSYLAKARTAMLNRSYDEALYYATSIPECCVGYGEANKLIQQIYKDNIDLNAQVLLAQAQGAWGAHPDEQGAEEAYALLAQIDPSSSSYAAAQALSKRIASVVKENWDFENKEKYRNEVALEKQRIAAARDVGVAYAKSRPRTVTNFIVTRPVYRYY